MIDYLEDGMSTIELLDHMGSELDVVNAARVSYGKESAELTDRDLKLITYMATNKHTSPFRHSYVKFRVKAPIFLSRQLYKHVVGIETLEFMGGGAWSLDTYDAPSQQDHGWNEISMRYVEVEPQFFTPRAFRAQSTTNKQASVLGVEVDQGDNRGQWQWACRTAYEAYRNMLTDGVAKEQARGVLPVCIYTEWIWTLSLQAALHVIELRDHEGAQYEAQQFARAMRSLLEPLFPVSLTAWGMHV